jgi:hypothetical protein
MIGPIDRYGPAGAQAPGTAPETLRVKYFCETDRLRLDRDSRL